MVLQVAVMNMVNSASSAVDGNFGPAEKLVRGTKISGISVRADHFFPENFAPP